jgi:hypothetical protein
VVGSCAGGFGAGWAPARKYADLVAVGSQMGCGPKARRAIRLRHVAYVSMVALCEEGLATEGEDKLMWQEHPNGAPQGQHEGDQG